MAAAMAAASRGRRVGVTLASSIVAGAVAAVSVVAGAAPSSSPSPPPPPPVDVYRPVAHVMPATNWMNDPNGPFYDAAAGAYHLFYQYNPWGAVWGNMSWGHAVSADLVFWRHLPVALYPNDSYDAGGVFSGSITVVAGAPVIAYTCVSGDGEEQQCLAYPANASDPDLVAWVKASSNPVIPPPAGTAGNNFRDPTTAWRDSVTGAWLMAAGNLDGANDGIVQLYESPDFATWAYSNALFVLPGGGMLECPDVYSVGGGATVLKVSNGPDSYWVGVYNASARTFTPTSPRTLYDYGQGYASKSFWDPVGARQVLWIWVAEEDAGGAARGWQGMQSLPRVITLDAGTGLLSMAPPPELAALRNATLDAVAAVTLPAGAWLPLPAAAGLALEVDAYFALPPAAANATSPVSFGVAVLATADGATATAATIAVTPPNLLQNNTDRPGDDIAIFAMDATAPEADNIATCQAWCAGNATCVAWVYVRPGDGGCRCCFKGVVPAADANPFCVSGVIPATYTVAVNRSASTTDGNTFTQGGAIPVGAGESPATSVARLHVFLDHSIVEVFANNGRARVTSRVYPTDAAATGVGLFATGAAVTLLNATVWSLNTIWL